MTKHIGQKEVADVEEIVGQVTGTIFVRAGAKLVMMGQAAGGIVIDDGAEVILHGQSARNIVNDGHLTVHGQVVGKILGKPAVNQNELGPEQLVGQNLPVPIS